MARGRLCNDGRREVGWVAAVEGSMEKDVETMRANRPTFAECALAPIIAQREAARLQSEAKRLAIVRGSWPSMTPIPPISEDLPEICKEYCKECGVETVTWFTDSDIWNLLNTPGILCPNCFVHLIGPRGFSTTGWKLVPEERIAKLTADNEEADKLIADTVDTLTIWTKQGLATPEGYTPMWNPTLRRLRNYLASRATRTPPQEGQ